MRYFCILGLCLVASLPLEAQNLLGVFGFGGLDPEVSSVYLINPATGEVTELARPIVKETLLGIAQLKDGRVVVSTLSASLAARLIEIDPETGALVSVIGEFRLGADNPLIGDLTVDLVSGALYGIQPLVQLRQASVLGFNPNNVYLIDPDTADCTFVGQPDIGPLHSLSLAFTSDGTLWGKSSDTPDFVTLDPADGSILTNTSLTPPIGGWTLENLGDDTFLTNSCCEAGGNQFYRIDPLARTATPLGFYGEISMLEDLAVVQGTSAIEVPTLGQAARLIFGAALFFAGLGLLSKR